MQLIADNLWTFVHGHLPVGLLDPPTSYFQKGAWFSKAYKAGFWDGKIRFMQMDKATKLWKFPTGLLQNVLDYLDAREYRYELSDLRTVPNVSPVYELYPDIRMNVGKYDYQGRALEACLQSGRGVVKAGTGGGKSEIGAAVINSVGGRWVWLTHKTTLLYQTRERLSRRLQRPIGILGDQEEQLEEVTVAMVQTLSSIFRKSGREHVREWFRTCHGILGDEIHHLESDQWTGVFEQSSALWRIGLTATPPQMDDGGMALMAMTGPILFEIPSKDLVARGVLVPPRIWVIPVDQPVIKGKKDWREVYKLAITHNQYRHDRIADAVRVFSSEKKPSLVLVKQINHGEQIIETLQERGMSAGWITGKVSQKDRDFILDDLWNHRLHTVVAVAETMGEGVDLPQLRAVINATGTRGGGSSKGEDTGRQTIQFLGRGLRSEPGKLYFDYVDFADLCHKSTKQASLDRVDTLEAEGYGDFIRYWSEYESAELRRMG